MTVRRRLRGGILLGFASLLNLAALLAPSPVLAQPAPQIEERRYDIAEQPLAAALADYATVSGVDIIYPQSLARGRRTRGLRGSFTAAIALKRLLEGTGLIARFNGPTAAVISEEVAAADTASTTSERPVTEQTLRLEMAEVRAPRLVGMRDRAAYERYGRAIQSEIHALVHEHGGYQGFSYRTNITVRIDLDGVIREVVIEKPSAAPEWDAHLLRLLDGRRLSAPPPAGFTGTFRFAVETKDSERRRAR